jgi:hypothetical protein
MPTPTRPPPPCAELAAAQRAVNDLAAALNDEGPYAPELTRTAAEALTTAACYLRLCLSAAQPAATPTFVDLTDIALALYEAVSRFVDITTGDRQYLYTLGPLGAVVYPTQFNDPNRPDARAPRTNIERTERIIGSRRLAHLLGTNSLFIDLIAYTRTDQNARLARWWSEQHTTAVYARSGIQPDGHGVWIAGGTQVGFFAEHDNGTEPLGTVLRKLRRYEQLAAYGPRYPVLLRVPSRRREANLLDMLAGVPTAMPVAAGIHGEHPAGPAWTLTSDPGLRRWLHELPSDPGPDNPATNPGRFPDDGPANIGDGFLAA